MMDLKKCLECKFAEIRKHTNPEGKFYVEIFCYATGEKLILTKCPFVSGKEEVIG